MMTHAMRSPWMPRLATFTLWALAGAGLLYWALALSLRSAGPPPAAPVHSPTIDTPAVARLLGAGVAVQADTAEPAAPAVHSRFRLQGVLAGTASGGGAALIGVDGKPARPFRVGAAVEPGLVVQSLSRREVKLGASVDGTPSLTLGMPLKP